MVRPYTVGKPFRFWCQKILPLVYDDSLSYYELLNKVVDYLNKVINNVDSIGEAFNDLGGRFESLQSSFNELSEMVDNYFDNLDVQQEINNKLDEMAKDGTLDALIQPLVDSAVSDAVSEWCVTPEMFGASGNGSADDTTAIQNAINEAVSRGLPLYFPKKTYKVTNTLSISSRIDITGNLCFINGTIDDAPVIRYAPTAEIRNSSISSIGIRNYGTGDALEISSDYSFVTCLIRECSFYASSGWCLRLNEKFSHSKVQLCTFSGNGIYAECGDANTFEKNMFFGADKTGIYLNTPSYGELNNAIINNTIVNAGYAILIDSGDQTWICNNQIEYNGSSDSKNNPSAMLYIRGDTRSVKHCIIENNNFGGGTHLNYDVCIKCGDENVIKGNRFVAVNTADVYVQNGGSTGSTRNYFMDDNFSVAQPSNPRTDTYQKVKTTAALPKCLIGCWYDVYQNGSSSKTIKVKKCADGTLLFSPTTIFKTTEIENTNVIFTLPTKYRPSINTYVTAIWTGSGTASEVTLKIGYNGEVSFVEHQAFTSGDIFIPGIVVPV